MLDQLSGSTRLFPIVGDPVTWARSPVRLTATFAARGHRGVCVPLQVAEGDLDVVMAGLAAAGNVDGVLVTMPHKAAAAALCTTTSQRSALLGVVSVVRRAADGGWHGEMLDGLAFVRAQVDHGATVDGAAALLLGAGGAGSAIALALLEAGVARLVVHDAEASRARALLDLLGERGGGRVSVGPPDPAGSDLVLNATPAGMDERDPLPIDAASLTAGTFVGDVVAGHGTTALLAAARAAGCATASGDDVVEAVQDLMADFLLGQDPAGRTGGISA